MFTLSNAILLRIVKNSNRLVDPSNASYISNNTSKLSTSINAKTMDHLFLTLFSLLHKVLKDYAYFDRGF